MKITIKSEKNGVELEPVYFEINFDGLINAVETCYLSLGTLYDPIKMDSFVNTGNDGFSFIDEETKVSLSLESLDTNKVSKEGSSSFQIYDTQLVCCKLNIVDKEFIKNGGIANLKQWKKIFKIKKRTYAAPDGTLYIAPNKLHECVITSKKSKKNHNISYSILIALTIKFDKEEPRPFYFIIDPLVKVSAKGGG